MDGIARHSAKWLGRVVCQVLAGIMLVHTPASHLGSGRAGDIRSVNPIVWMDGAVNMLSRWDVDQQWLIADAVRVVVGRIGLPHGFVGAIGTA